MKNLITLCQKILWHVGSKHSCILLLYTSVYLSRIKGVSNIMEFKLGMPLTEGYYCKVIKIDKLDNQ